MIKNRFGLFSGLFVIFCLTIISWKSTINPANPHPEPHFSLARKHFQKYEADLYDSAHLRDAGISFSVFEKAFTGFVNLKLLNKVSAASSLLTVIDYTKSSCEQRLWIIDVVKKSVVLQSLVAHGEGSGEDIATQFSDNTDSHQSSVGFYLTDNVYYGKHGRSLKLDGLDTGFNANARARDIVLHGAIYVNEGIIAVKGRLGRSFGCPAVPLKLVDRIIDNIKNRNVLFINGSEDVYGSGYINEELAAQYMQRNDAQIELANL